MLARAPEDERRVAQWRVAAVASPRDSGQESGDGEE